MPFGMATQDITKSNVLELSPAFNQTRAMTESQDSRRTSVRTVYGKHCTRTGVRSYLTKLSVNIATTQLRILNKY